MRVFCSHPRRLQQIAISCKRSDYNLKKSQHSTLSSLMSKRFRQVALFFDAAQSASSELIDFQIWFFPNLSDAVEASTLGSLTLHRETKFIIGFDFAVTLSSPASSFVLFDITSRQLVELKWLKLNKHKR